MTFLPNSTWAYLKVLPSDAPSQPLHQLWGQQVHIFAFDESDDWSDAEADYMDVKDDTSQMGAYTAWSHIF